MLADIFHCAGHVDSLHNKNYYWFLQVTYLLQQFPNFIDFVKFEVLFIYFLVYLIISQLYSTEWENDYY